MSAATIGYLLLLFSVYFFTGLLKRSAEWNSEGSAMYYAFSLDQMVWPLGKSLLPYPHLLKCLSVLVRWFELLVPFLLLIPYKNKVFRLAFVLCIATLHLCICMTLYVGLFYLIGLSSLLGLLPSSLMNWFDKKITRKKIRFRFNAYSSSIKKISANYYFNVVKNSFLFFCMALCMLWNISTVSCSGVTVSTRFFTFGYGLRFNQNWGMFAPTVFKDDGWYIMEGLTKDSLKIDINRKGAEADYTKPLYVLDYIKDDRWRKFSENYLFTFNEFIRPYYCHYLLNDWNKNHSDKKISSLQIIYMKEISVLPPQKQKATKEVLCICAE